MHRLLFSFCLLALPSFSEMSVSEANVIIREQYGKYPAWKRQQAWKIISRDAHSLGAVAKMPVGSAPGWVRAKAFELYPNSTHYSPVRGEE